MRFISQEQVSSTVILSLLVVHVPCDRYVELKQKVETDGEEIMANFSF